MKQILPLLFLFLFIIFPVPVFAAISFTISNPVLEGDYYIVDASLSGISSDSAYVFGMFTSSAKTDYFGYTWGQKENWVPYQTTSKDFITGNLPRLIKDTGQKIWIKPNFEDSGYSGPGDYILKLKRYTGSSDGSSGDSNSLTVHLSAPVVQTPTPTAAPTVTESPTTTPTPTPTHIVTSTPVVTNPPTRTPTPTISSTLTPSKTTTPTIATTPTILEPTTLGINTTTPSADISFQDSTISSIPSITLSVEASHSDTPRKPIPYRNLFLIGVLISSISGGLLYLRLRNR